MVNKYPGNSHGEWLFGTQDEALSHPGIAAVTQQLAAIVEFGTDVPSGQKKLYHEGELGWLFGHADPKSLFLPGGASQYPRDMRYHQLGDYKPETRVVFGSRTVVSAYNLMHIQQELYDQYGDLDLGPEVGRLSHPEVVPGWRTNVFRVAWPAAVELLLDPDRPMHHITLAVGDSNQIKVPETREDGNRNAKRLFSNATFDVDPHLKRAARVIWSKMVPNGRAVLPVGTRLFSVLAAYKLRSPDSDHKVQLETHVFADLTKDEIAVLSQLVAEPATYLAAPQVGRPPRPDGLLLQVEREGFTSRSYPTCQVVSAVQYLGVLTVPHRYMSGSGTLFAALEPTSLKTATLAAADAAKLRISAKQLRMERRAGF